MAKSGMSKEMAAVVAAGRWAWANRDKIRSVLQSEPVQQALRSQPAQQVIASPVVRRVVGSPQVQAVVGLPEVQRWFRDVAPVAPRDATPPTSGHGEFEPYTGETRRLG